MKLQLPCQISDSLLLLVVQVVLRHVAGDWGSAIPFGIEALPFLDGIWPLAFPFRCRRGWLLCCGVQHKGCTA